MPNRNQFWLLLKVSVSVSAEPLDTANQLRLIGDLRTGGVGHVLGSPGLIPAEELRQVLLRLLLGHRNTNAYELIWIVIQKHCNLRQIWVYFGTTLTKFWDKL